MKCGSLRNELMEAVLSGPDLASLAAQEHLATCADCAREVASLRQTMDLLGEWRTPEPSPYFSVRLRARLREEKPVQTSGWLDWLRRPAVVTAAAALMAVGVGLLEGAHSKVDHRQTMADNNPPVVTTNAVSDLQYLDSHADLFTDFDALDDSQTETN
jgi:anti-sigma factor RsiW